VTCNLAVLAARKAGGRNRAKVGQACIRQMFNNDARVARVAEAARFRLPRSNYPRRLPGDYVKHNGVWALCEWQA
jgi:hypothetical protein